MFIEPLAYAELRHLSKNFLVFKMPRDFLDLSPEELAKEADILIEKFNYSGKIVFLTLDDLERAITKGQHDLAVYARSQENNDLIAWNML